MSNLTPLEIKLIRQLNALTQLGLKIDDKYDGVTFLMQYGEGPLLKYEIFFFDSENKVFRENTKLSDIIDLFYFDMKIRRQIMSAMELFEQTFKQAMKYVIAKRISNRYFEYTAIENLNEQYVYYNKADNYTDQIRRKNVKSHFRQVRNRLKKDDVPLNEMIDNLYFNNVSDWYFLLKEPVRNEVNKCLCNGVQYENIDDDEGYQYIENLIRLCNGFRNQAAHGGIMFNYYEPSLRVNYGGIYIRGRRVMLDEPQYHCGIGILLILISATCNVDVKKELFYGIHDILKNFFADHEDMKKDILHAMALDTLIGLHTSTGLGIFDDLA